MLCLAGFSFIAAGMLIPADSQPAPTSTAVATASGPSTTGGQVGVVSPRKHTKGFKPFSITFPANARGKDFTNAVLLHLRIASDGSVTEGKVARSTGIASVDEQVLAGVKAWKFQKSKDGLSLDLAVVIDIR
jgi:TonB family protein